MKTITQQQLAYFLLRITMGVNFFGHGLVRLTKIDDFRTWMLGEFKNAPLPEVIPYSFATVLPFIEFGIGVFLILGLFTRQVIISGALIIIVLIFGSCLIEKWDFVGFQMIYAISFFLLLHLYPNNTLTLNSKLEK